jgi:hypothetical protein
MAAPARPRDLFAPDGQLPDTFPHKEETRFLSISYSIYNDLRHQAHCRQTARVLAQAILRFEECPECAAMKFLTRIDVITAAIFAVISVVVLIRLIGQLWDL